MGLLMEEWGIHCKVNCSPHAQEAERKKWGMDSQTPSHRPTGLPTKIHLSKVSVPFNNLGVETKLLTHGRHLTIKVLLIPLPTIQYINWEWAYKSDAMTLLRSMNHHSTNSTTPPPHSIPYLCHPFYFYCTKIYYCLIYICFFCLQSLYYKLQETGIMECFNHWCSLVPTITFKPPDTFFFN